MEKLIDIEAACKILGVSRPTLANMRDEGLPYYMVGGRVKFFYSDIVGWLKKQKKAPVTMESEAGASVPGEEGHAHDTSPVAPCATVEEKN
jgi:excisionase family DNA binding protein